MQFDDLQVAEAAMSKTSGWDLGAIPVDAREIFSDLLDLATGHCVVGLRI
jgi:hypothetical protein